MFAGLGYWLIATIEPALSRVTPQLSPPFLIELDLHHVLQIATTLIVGLVVCILWQLRKIWQLRQASTLITPATASPPTTSISIFDQADVAMNQADAKTGRFLRANQHFCDLLGYTETELQQLTYAEVTYPDDRAAHQARVQRVLDGTVKSSTSEQRYLHKDGASVWTQVTISRICDSAGQVLSNLAIVQDIRDRKQTEEALRASESKTQAILEAIPDLMFRLDVNGRFVDYHAAKPTSMRQYWQGRPGLHVRDVLPKPLAGVHLKHLKRALATRELQVYEQGINVAGQVRYEEVRVMASSEHEVLFMIRDITERKEARRQLEQQLEQSLLLKNLTSQIRKSLDLQQIFQTTVQQLGRALAVNRCTVHRYLITPEPTIPVAAEYLEAGQQPMCDVQIPVLENTHMLQVLAQDDVVAVDDVNQESSLKQLQTLWADLEIRSMLTVRTSYKGEPNGIIGLHQCDRVRPWTQIEIDLLQAVASQVGIA
ncbi:MAG: PAS domain S-box protein, partial [Cyanobacteria bacterium P01_H01_bin.121]